MLNEESKACALFVMARLVPRVYAHLALEAERTWSGNRDGQCMSWISATCAAADGPDKPGHDGWTTFATALICLAIAEMCVRPSTGAGAVPWSEEMEGVRG